MITALLTSVNYNDFLEFLLPKNLSQFDEIIVLTVESDTDCKRICDRYDRVRCLVFEDSVLKKHGKNFNKGVYNKGLEYLDSINYNEWLCLQMIFCFRYIQRDGHKTREENECCTIRQAL